MKQGKYYMKDRNCYIVTEFEDTAHQQPTSMQIFRSFKDIDKCYTDTFKHPQDMNDYIKRYCSKNKKITTRNGKQAPKKAFLYVQRTRLTLPCYHRYQTNSHYAPPPSASDQPGQTPLLPTLDGHAHLIEEFSRSNPASRVCV